MSRQDDGDVNDDDGDDENDDSDDDSEYDDDEDEVEHMGLWTPLHIAGIRL